MYDDHHDSNLTATGRQPDARHWPDDTLGLQLQPWLDPRRMTGGPGRFERYARQIEADVLRNFGQR